MAKLFDQDMSIVPTWLSASRYLLECTKEGYKAQNLVLEITDPRTMTKDDAAMIRRVDDLMRNADADTAIERVAATIFPEGMYRRIGYPAFYERYLDTMVRAKKAGTWGTYAMRLMSRTNGDETINPLETVIRKLSRATSGGHRYRNGYELSVHDVALDLPGDALDFGCEVPLYEPVSDAGRVSNSPCLSHLSFKLGASNELHLTAVYRSHYYCSKTLGNLIGLARLQAFVAKQAKLDGGSLTCISTFANLDVKAWGGMKATRALLASAAA
jgi:hypothetical protein